MRIKYNNAYAIPIIAKIVHSQKLMREGRTRSRNNTWDGLTVEVALRRPRFGSLTLIMVTGRLKSNLQITVPVD